MPNEEQATDAGAFKVLFEVKAKFSGPAAGVRAFCDLFKSLLACPLCFLFLSSYRSALYGLSAGLGGFMGSLLLLLLALEDMYLLLLLLYMYA